MKKEKMNCKYCQGYGFWAWGPLTSMGRMDSEEFPTIPCPFCGSIGAHPLKGKFLEKQKERIKEIKRIYGEEKK